MESVVTLTGMAIVAFASTNVDDAFVLVAFITNRDFRVGDVVLGQYGGMAAMYSLSVVAALISVTIPPQSLGLLGLIPIAIGIKKALWRSPSKTEVLRRTTRAGAHRRILAVAAVTVANGGDNIAAYTALFANLDRSALPLVGLVFAGMTGIWCIAALWLTNHRALGVPIQHYANRLVPFVLIGLGVLILIKTGTAHLLKGSLFG
jgi:cadmium resistance protein CadD (predicted permease)